MTQHEFMNRLRGLWNIDADQLPELDRQQYAAFSAFPPQWLIRCDDVQADAIWREIEKRQRT